MEKIIKSGKYHRVRVVDVDEHPDIKKFWNVKSWPTYIVYSIDQYIYTEIFRTHKVSDL